MRNLQNKQEISMTTNINLNGMVSDCTTRSQISCEPNVLFTNNNYTPILHPGVGVTTGQQKLNEQRTKSAIHSSKRKEKQIIYPVLSEHECAFVIDGTTFYSCPVCKQTFFLFSELQEHNLRSHAMRPKSKKLKCDMCDKRFMYKSHLTIHKGSHIEDRAFKCDMCHKAFKVEMRLNAHKKRHTYVKKYLCDECDFVTTGNQWLLYHKNRCHTKVLDFICKICGRNCSSPYELNYHLSTHGEKQCKCKHCGKAFSNKHLLGNHETIHDPNRVKCQCEICGHKFKSVNGLRKHKLHIHFGEKRKQYQCEYCEKTVTSLGSLKIHRRKHTGDKPFSCDTCEKAFSSKSVLTAHKRVHTGEKPFTCHLCEKSYSQQGTLIIHMRSHTGDMRFECENCSKAFLTKTALKSHMKRCNCTTNTTHSPEVADETLN